MSKDTSVYARTGRSHWYVSYWSPKRLKRVHVATAWRIDDPAGRKYAMRFAAEKSQESAAFHGTAKLEMWSTWVEKFIDDRYRSSPKTLARYHNAWDWLRVYLDERQLHLPAAVNYNHVLGYVDWRTQKKRHCGRPISRNTALCDVRAWSVIMREAMRRGFATTNPCERLGLRRDPVRRKPELSEDEIAKIRAEVQRLEGGRPVTERWMTVSFEIALHQGCRLSETSLPMTAVDLERGTITFAAKGREGGEPHVFTTALHPELRPLMTKLLQAGAVRTCTLPRMAAKEWWALRKEIGLGHTTFHSTRVTVITRLARAGVPIQQAMRFVGHANEAVHRIYQRLGTEDLLACTDALTFDQTAAKPPIP